MRKITVLIALIIACGVSVADDFGKAFNHVTFVVSDLDASKKFYSEILGFKPLEASWLPEGQAFLDLGNGLELHIGEVAGVEIKPNKINHFAIAVRDFDKFLAYLKSNDIVYTRLGGGADYFIATRGDGVRQTWITDPDGYWIEINDID